MWTENGTTQSAAAPQANDVDLKGTVMAAHLVGARTTDETLYGIVKPEWNKMSPEEKSEVLKKASAFASEKGFRKVHLLNDRGRTVGFKAGEKEQILDPA